MKHTTVESPIGPILLIGDGRRIAGLYTAEHVRRPTPQDGRDDAAFKQVSEQLTEYFDGDRTEFDLELDLVGTDFQRRVWQELRQIGYGERVTYGQIAARVGAPAAVRAVGTANGRNRISIIVPCHRVVGSTGKLTGYAGGMQAKQWLLDHESPAAQLSC